MLGVDQVSNLTDSKCLISNSTETLRALALPGRVLALRRVQSSLSLEWVPLGYKMIFGLSFLQRITVSFCSLLRNGLLKAPGGGLLGLSRCLAKRQYQAVVYD
jgi:hypothetical protein